jgi:hypothetical protein
MLRTEREDLLKVARHRERIAKAQLAALASQRKADFETQLASEYRWDEDDIWRQAHEVANQAVKQAKEEIVRRAVELGIPRAFAPDLNLSWYSRGANLCKARREELIRVAHARIDQMVKEGKVAVEAASVEFQTRLITDGLESAEARGWLERMPTPEQLMPVLPVGELQKQLPGRMPREYDNDYD